MLEKVGHTPFPGAFMPRAHQAGDVDRLVLTLLHLEGNSVEEIAEVTGWSKSMVKVQAHRARARLRKLVEAGEQI